MSIPKHTPLSQDLKNAIQLLGDEWVLSILCNLSRQTMRFNELQRSIEGINPTTLANRLKVLEQEKIISREEETVDKLSVVYELTKKGKGVLPIIAEMRSFSEKFL